MPTLAFILRGATTPVHHEFPDDCVIHVGRAPSPGALTVAFRDGRFDVRAHLASLSEDHCVITIRRGVATLEDHGSRNGTFVRLLPLAVHPLDGQPVLLCQDLSFRLEIGSDPPIPELRDPTPDRLISALRPIVSARSLRVELGPPGDTSFPLYGDTRHLIVRPTHPTRTLSLDDVAWVQRAVNAYNAAVDSQRDEVPWRFLAASRGRRHALEQARRAAATNLPVLLLGPTGAGKEVLANDLHQHSTRRHGPFVSVNCAALDADRLEAQLFGHVRGAYTGAHADSRGLVEAAADGTLFLDEIGDMAPEVQGKLLRFLESSTGEYRRMGEVKVRHARVRIIAATLRSISGSDNHGFREDLYFRLAGVRIDIPRLDREDVQVIAAQLLREAAGQSAHPPSTHEVERIAQAAAERMWPGGARELRQCVERCIQLRAPDASWAASWESAVQAPLSSRSPSTHRLDAPVAQPAVIGRMLADLLFLHTARDARKVAPLARSLQVSYQAVDTRLQNFGVRIGDADRFSALIEERTEELRRLTRHDDGVARILKRLIDP